MDWDSSEWASGNDRRILIETVNEQLVYIRGNEAFDLVESASLGEPVKWDLDVEGGLPRGVIGERQQIVPGLLTAPVSKVIVGFTAISPDGTIEDEREAGVLDDEEFEQRGEDPFVAADELLESLYEQAIEEAVERVDRAKSLAKNLGHAAMGRVMSYAGSVSDHLQELRARAAEFNDRTRTTLRGMGRIAINGLFDAGWALSLEMQDGLQDLRGQTSEFAKRRLRQGRYLGHIAGSRIVSRARTIHEGRGNLVVPGLGSQASALEAQAALSKPNVELGGDDEGTEARVRNYLYPS